MKDRKKLPYGKTNFEALRQEGCVYIDKTRFIERLEEEDNGTLFFARPRKFGKSLFLSMLSSYYDVLSAEKFPALFGDLYIGQHPTPNRNKYLVLNFNFTGIETLHDEGFARTFVGKIRDSVTTFLDSHRAILPDADRMKDYVKNQEIIISILGTACEAALITGRHLFVIIDEYDHFANDFVALGTQAGIDSYHRHIHANGIVRDFYEILKEKTTTVVDRIFITGVTPIMLDDLTSGFNIATNITLRPGYNEMMGFTRQEVDRIMAEAGVDPARISLDLEFLYDGYRFDRDAEQSVYNPSMINYFLMRLRETDYRLDQVIDGNIKTDYGRLRRLLASPENRKRLLKIIEDNGIIQEPIPMFPLDNLSDRRYFVSLLFYMGLLTIDASAPLRMKIPNYTIRTVYWGYLEEQTLEMNQLILDEERQPESMLALAYGGDPKPFLDYVTGEIFSKLSNRDLIQFDEKYLKILLLSRLFQSHLFIPVSEAEVSTGYMDIYLERGPRYGDIPWEWVWEIKYLKGSEGGKEGAVEEAFGEARGQLEKYRRSHRLEERGDVRYLAVVFIGKDAYRMEELTEREGC